MSDDSKYPISEIFTSWQGEGLWAGTRMTFIRFAGCNVGKPIPSIDKSRENEYSKSTLKYGYIPLWQEECTTFDGRKFCCDTDFRVKERLTVYEILHRIPKDITHVCFTGGEPLLHIEKIDRIINEYYNRRLLNVNEPTFHIETSGTIQYSRQLVWITVSPKKNVLPFMIKRANEVKFLVDKDFSEEEALELAKLDDNNDTIFWLSPINGINELDKSNMDKCKEIAERHSNWRITLQQHKILEVR